ncbi:MAG: PhzF family phenazine biosynthesis protein, partial [Anaerolineae bacterium]|nr:PhzF family phenazine biosynthesis protein [Anaerolineae bacterium]
LCGHATLATAAVLFRELHVPSDTLTFETLSGTLAARQTELGITLDFPADDPAPYTPPEGVLEALGIETPEEVVYAAKTRKLLIRLASAGEIRALKPDFTRLKAATEAAHVQGPIVTAPGTPPYDFVSRFFAPAVGIDEDPVTGSAHTVLGPYWARRSGKTTLYAYQASARGGEVHVALLPKNRVALSGDAVVVFSGKLRVEDTGVV